jgi:hypothetical protein
MAQPLSNFVDKVSTIIAAWLNNVDQAINGTGTSLMGAGLVPYTPGGTGGQPASPAGSVGAALDGIAGVEVLSFSTSAALSITSSFSDVKGAVIAGSATSSPKGTMTYDPVVGTMHAPAGGTYLFNVQFTAGYSAGTTAFWETNQGFGYTNNINASVSGQSDSLTIQMYRFLTGAIAINQTLQLSCTTNNTVNGVTVTVAKLR